MNDSTPCEQLNDARRNLFALGSAQFALRGLLSVDDDDFTGMDGAICSSLSTLEDIQLMLAQQLVTAHRRHEVWLKKLREDAQKQVQEDNDQ